MHVNNTRARELLVCPAHTAERSPGGDRIAARRCHGESARCHHRGSAGGPSLVVPCAAFELCVYMWGSDTRGAEMVDTYHVMCTHDNKETSAKTWAKQCMMDACVRREVAVPRSCMGLLQSYVDQSNLHTLKRLGLYGFVTIMHESQNFTYMVHMCRENNYGRRLFV